MDRYCARKLAPNPGWAVVPDGASSRVVTSGLKPSLSAKVQAKQAEYYGALGATKKLDAFLIAVETALKGLELTEYALTRLAIGEPSKPLFQTIGADFRGAYVEDDLAKHDIALEHAVHRTTPLFRSEIDAHLASLPLSTPSHRHNIALTNALNRFGYEDVYYAPVRAFDGIGCLLLIIVQKDMSAREFRERLELVRLDIHVLVEAIDFVGGHKFPSMFRKKPLSRESSVGPKVWKLMRLLVNQDMTLDQAAARLGCHINTVRRLLRAFRKAYGARNTHTAVFHASKEGLFDRSKM